MSTSRDPLVPTDPVAVEIKTHLLNMESDGYGTFRMELENASGQILLAFGHLQLHTKNCDIGLVRLAGLLLEDPKFSNRILAVLRGEV